MKRVARYLSPHWLFSQVDNSPLVIFRLLLGLLITAEAVGAIVTGWVERVFIRPEFTFSFIGFEWLQPLPGDGMYYYFIAMGVSGILIALGLFYRVGAVAFAILWTGVYLMQKTAYNNHYYLLMLMSWVMILLPANKRFSLDCKFGITKTQETCPRVCHKFWVFQVVLVYSFACFNKVYPDWLNGDPINIWFASKKDFLMIGPWLQYSWVQLGVTWGGVLYDGLIGPLLLYRRTRGLGVVLCVFFNIFNSAVFHIGIFPYLMIAFLVFFYPPASVSRFFFRNRIPATAVLFQGNYILKSIMYFIFIAYAAVQIMLPLRHYLYPGDVHWTEEGHRLSWQMMLRSKTGNCKFKIINNTTGYEEIHNPVKGLTFKQYFTMASHPDFIWQYVQRLKKIYASKGMHDISIYVIGEAKLNKRGYTPIIDPNYDMSKAAWHRFQPSPWITRPYQ